MNNSETSNEALLEEAGLVFLEFIQQSFPPMKRRERTAAQRAQPKCGVLIDGLTAILLPYVAVVDMAIVLVAPRRACARTHKIT